MPDLITTKFQSTNQNYPKNTHLGNTLTSVKTLRNKAYEKDVTTDDKIRSAFGSLVGTIIPLFMIMKKQKSSSIFKLEYGLKEMLILSSTSILGAVGFGMIGENKNAKQNKVKEGIFQFLNASLPTTLVGLGLEGCKNTKKFNTPFVKIMTTLVGIIGGMYISTALANIICDPKDLEPDRKLTFKDSIVNVDDILGALVLARVPFINKLKVEKVLPFLYAYCGYRAGKCN